MKYKKFKEALDKYFKDDDEIYPHAGCGMVLFCDIYHGQQAVKIDLSDMDMAFIDVQKTPEMNGEEVKLNDYEVDLLFKEVIFVSVNHLKLGCVSCGDECLLFDEGWLDITRLVKKEDVYVSMLILGEEEPLKFTHINEFIKCETEGWSDPISWSGFSEWEIPEFKRSY